MLPIQKMFFDNNYEDYNQFNQSVLLKLKKEIFLSHLERVLQRITRHHDALRMIYMRENGSWKQEIRDVDAVSYTMAVQMKRLGLTKRLTNCKRAWI